MAAWRFARGPAPTPPLRDSGFLVLGMVLGLLLSRCMGYCVSKRRSSSAAGPLRLRRFTWDDFCLVLVHLQRDRYSHNVALQWAVPDLGPRVAELVALCRTQGVEVLHLRDGSAPQRSPWYRFWLRMNPGGDASADPTAAEVFAAERPGEKVFVSSGYDAVGVDSGLEPYVHSRGRSVVFICGLTTSCAVHANALGFFLRGYETFVVGDCCGDHSRKMHAGTLRRECRRSYAVCSLQGVRELLAAGPRFDMLADFGLVPTNTTQFEVR
eukprot:CAMPEP_0175220126 /NCGR_PEP_ID=MMETSP0093-20121207/19623_1 /TAXON_ID=311494 /ORGANISM="Alexandrium monilatum, Strain CCMP3105" /LENGTH=267 /DNA_ID=CAMNT_0016513623 /DNA_START=19 /DNA_END=822 /DNA_ORIENTATION=+